MFPSFSPLTVNAAEHRVLEQHGHVRLGRLLQRHERGRLEPQPVQVEPRGQPLRDLLDDPGERRPRNEQPRRVGPALGGNSMGHSSQKTNPKGARCHLKRSIPLVHIGLVTAFPEVATSVVYYLPGLRGSYNLPTSLKELA